MADWEKHMSDFIPDEMLTFTVKENTEEVVFLFFFFFVLFFLIRFLWKIYNKLQI